MCYRDLDPSIIHLLVQTQLIYLFSLSRLFKGTKPHT